MHKNSEIFAQLKNQRELKKQMLNSMSLNKEKKLKCKDEIDLIDKQIEQLHKKAIGGQILSRDKLEQFIMAKEFEKNNKPCTAIEERKFCEEIAMLKENMIYTK